MHRKMRRHKNKYIKKNDCCSVMLSLRTIGMVVGCARLGPRVAARAPQKRMWSPLGPGSIARRAFREHILPEPWKGLIMFLISTTSQSMVHKRVLGPPLCKRTCVGAPLTRTFLHGGHARLMANAFFMYQYLARTSMWRIRALARVLLQSTADAMWPQA